MTDHPEAQGWVRRMAALCQPDSVAWCDGSEEEKNRLLGECLASGELEALNPEKWPDCTLHRSDPNDVARTEDLTFICTREKADAGVTNNWMAPPEAYRKLEDIFRGSMKGRTMYVVPFIMGPAGSPFQKIGIEITDSRYVVLSLRVMTRLGRSAL